ncbi:MAG: hypothetical protein LBU04_01115 [Christensenellaceae bacterium]|nr:hypothetical protein [Christensenellaceae bacterium]
MSENIYKFLIDEGIPTNIAGFRYVMSVVKILQSETCRTFNGGKGIFARVGMSEDKLKNWRTIERLCRHAKSKANRYTNMTLSEWLCWASAQTMIRNEEE